MGSAAARGSLALMRQSLIDGTAPQAVARHPSLSADAVLPRAPGAPRQTVMLTVSSAGEVLRTIFPCSLKPR